MVLILDSGQNLLIQYINLAFQLLLVQSLLLAFHAQGVHSGI